jgi:phage uncharacterized protein TIGR01671
MSREIKFRAWLKEEKKMVIVETIDFTDKSMQYLEKNEIIDAYLLRRMIFDDVELMQYTGIKDKNGKEIYEGDIVLIRIDKTNILHKTVVKFKHGAFIADIIGNNDYIYLFHFGFNKDDFEVIGNIYENKNLLEE